MRIAIVLAFLASQSAADPMLIEDFSDTQQGAWRFFTDQVMGGVSTGDVEISSGALTLSGNVSTANNGGFIQARLAPVSLPRDITALTIRAKGDGQRYFVHLRTSGMVLPSQYYQAAFEAGPDWQDIRLPLSAFKRSGRFLRDAPRAQDVTSIAIVAFGRDHSAQVSVARIRAD